jgi:RNA polymerase sigma-70 factor (ECF subfamily)
MGTALAANASAFDTAAVDTLDPLNFDVLVARHQSMVFGIAYHYLQNLPAAEDLAQDVFLQLHHHLSRLESAEHVTFWLRRVTAHRCIDYRRQHRFRFLSLDRITEPAHEPTSDDPLLSRRLQALVGELPPHARMAIVLRYQEDLTPDEIARVLGRPVATVKSQLQRALKTLRRKLRT